LNESMIVSEGCDELRDIRLYEPIKT